MDHDYDVEDDYAPRLLWGRLVFFVIALLLAFLLGRCTKATGVSEADFNAQQVELMELAEENEVLRQQLTAAGAAEDEEAEEDNGEDGGEEEATEEPDDDGEVADGETYTVQPGDTLTRIAQQFYDDPRKFDLIVDANNLDSGTQLRVGQELIIPPDPDA